MRPRPITWRILVSCFSSGLPVPPLRHDIQECATPFQEGWQMGREESAVQFASVWRVSATGVCGILAYLVAQADAAKSLYRSCELCVLRLVGLAVFVAYHFDCGLVVGERIAFVAA